MAFVLSTLLGIIHEATTSHIRCAEHGELIHGESATASSTAASTSAASSHETIERGLGAGGEIRGHEHCQLTFSTHESRCTPRPPVIAVAPAIIGELVAAPPRAVFARSTSLYLTAPKTSPPA
jgi:hypothetical protein